MRPDYPNIGMQWARVAMQRGFSIVSGIFLLVIMASLGTFMLMFSTVQQTTSAQDLEGSRAYQAARAGIEWGLYQALQVLPAPPAAPGPICAAAPASAATSLPALGSTLAAFAVTATCSYTDYTEAGNPVRVYQITSLAKNSAVPGSTRYVERQLQVTLSR